MATIRPSTFDEFALYFIRGKRRTDGRVQSIPDLPTERLKLMQGWTGKFCSWFVDGTWSIEAMTPDELEKTYILASDWTRADSLYRPPTPRTLGNAARFARETRYFQSIVPGRQTHHDYYLRLEEGSLILRGSERLVFREIQPGECEIPAGELYLHDGLGRALPFMTLAQEGKIPSNSTVDAFVVRKARPQQSEGR